MFDSLDAFDQSLADGVAGVMRRHVVLRTGCDLHRRMVIGGGLALAEVPCQLVQAAVVLGIEEKHGNTPALQLLSLLADPGSQPARSGQRAEQAWKPRRQVRADEAQALCADRT